MRVIADEDLETFTEHAWDWVAADPVRNTVAGSLVADRLAGTLPTEPNDAQLRVLDEHGTLIGIALVAGFGAIVSGLPAAAAEAVGRWFAEHRPALPWVTGPIPAAQALVHGFVAGSGAGAPDVEHRHASRLFAVRALAPPERPTPGRLRRAGAEDVELLTGYVLDFHADADPATTPGDPDALRASIARQIVELPDRWWLWEDAGRPVSMARLTRAMGGVPRLGAVYTPGALRGHGYATGCVAALTRHALERGAPAVVLFTDLANPTSNGIYRRLGYRPVEDQGTWAFVRGTQGLLEERRRAAAGSDGNQAACPARPDTSPVPRRTARLPDRRLTPASLHRHLPNRP